MLKMEQMTLFPETTVTEVKAFLKENWKKGAKCACCQQDVRLYRRPITSAMSYALILLYRESKVSVFTTYVHLENLFKGIPNLPSSIRGDAPKLRYWGLIEQSEKQDGFYRLTNEGKMFVEGIYKVQSHILLYNNKCYGIEGDYVDVKQCLKNKFNYESLMNGTL